MKRVLGFGLLASLMAALFAPVALADKKPTPGVLRVEDNAKYFSADGIKKAEDAFQGHTFKNPTRITIETFHNVPDSKKADFDEAKKNDGDLHRFTGKWARELAAGSKGIFILIFSQKGIKGQIHAIDDRQSDIKRGFEESDLHQLEKDLTASFVAAKGKSVEEAAKTRDEGLMKVANYVAEHIQDPDVASKDKDKDHKIGGMSIWGWVCIGISVLAGIWIVTALIRALTGGGGGGGNGGGGYGGGGGGGGGGFMTSMMGGLFGAAAGMYLYNHMFGSSVSDMSAGQGGMSGGGDYGNTDTGAGDYANGGDGGGTSDDWGDSSGGDAGGGDTGGGGDWGGGGDSGGGGGDW